MVVWGASHAWNFLPILVVLALQAASPDVWKAEASETGELDRGFHLLYELKPEQARAQFAVWQAAHPKDPIGSASEATSYLFEECFRQGLLTSEFFLDNQRFLGKVAIQPDARIRSAFFAADLKAQEMARVQLQTDPDDLNALFAMTLSLGMQADYASLIDRQQLESLAMIRKADEYAKRLLAANPDASDAYLTLGTANYIIGSLSPFKRLFLHFKGINGDKRLGLEQLEIAASRGHYLRPFAKILLGLAALREKKYTVARIQLTELVDEFPANFLFAGELAKLRTLPEATARGESSVAHPKELVSPMR